MTRPILLLHGLWFNSLSLLPLARRLRQFGHACQRFDYSTVGEPPETAIVRLCDALASEFHDGVDIVAHSMGGLIALEALRDAEIAVNRVVCLGSPLAGSATAAALARWRLGPRLLGHSAALLARGVGTWTGRAQVGVVAGTHAVGLGRAVQRFATPSDGTVAVAETRVVGLADHVELPASHTGLLFSAEVARQVDRFLRDGCFEHRNGR